MYGLYIVIEDDRATRTKVGPFTAEMRETVSNRAEAYRAFTRILDLMSVPISEDGVPGMGSVQSGPLV